MTEPKSGELIVVFANSVAEARHSLTVPEQRLILWLVAQIEREDDCLREHTLSIGQMKEILGREDTGALYNQIEQAVKRLQTRVLEIRTGPKERTTFNWLHRARYLDGEGKIQLQFHDDLKPVLLQLKARFCQIPLNSILRLRGGYAIKWLELLHARKHVGTFVLTIAELRDWLHIDDGELQRTDNLQARAIVHPQKELNAKSPLAFTFKPQKIGRRITGWIFKVKKNKPRPVPVKRKKGVSPVEPAARVTVENLQTLRESISGRRTGKAAENEIQKLNDNA